MDWSALRRFADAVWPRRALRIWDEPGRADGDVPPVPGRREETKGCHSMKRGVRWLDHTMVQNKMLSEFGTSLPEELQCFAKWTSLRRNSLKEFRFLRDFFAVQTKSFQIQGLFFQRPPPSGSTVTEMKYVARSKAAFLSAGHRTRRTRALLLRRRAPS